MSPRHGEPNGIDQFEVSIRKALSKLSRSGRGCLHCATGQCFIKFASSVDLLARWRLEFRALSPEAQDQQLLWMFMLRPHSGQPAIIAKRPCPSTDTSPAESKRARTSPESAPERLPTTPDAEVKDELEGGCCMSTTSDEGSAAFPCRRIPTAPSSESEDLDVVSGRSSTQAQEAHTHTHKLRSGKDSRVTGNPDTISFK